MAGPHPDPKPTAGDAHDDLRRQIAASYEQGARIEGLLREVLGRLPALEHEAGGMAWHRAVRVRRARMGEDLNRKLRASR
ncbi:MAG: hypothetical protein HY323_07160 [Betaproteobacteria bacterium]|nr:hypothetical protein [Betaproteobacteria bacterium]